MNSFYGAAVGFTPPTEEGLIYANCVVWDKDGPTGQPVQLQSDTKQLFGGETLKIDERVSLATSQVMMNGEVPVLSVSKVKKRYKAAAKYSEKDIGVMKGHGMTCALEYGAGYSEMTSTALDFIKLTQKLKKDEAIRLGVKETDFNLGQSVGLAVKLAAKSQAGKDLDRVERCANYFLTTIGEEVDKGIREWIGE